MVNISIIDIVYSSIICMLSGLCIYLSLYYSATNRKHVLSELIDAKTGAHRDSWCSQKQKTVPLSSREVEFMASIAAAMQTLWLRNLLGGLTATKTRIVTLYVFL
jgi:hypothetical protein